MEMNWWTKLKGWLVVVIPAVIGFAIALVLRKKPVSNPADEPVAKGPDMAQANENAKALEAQQAVIVEQHKQIEETLKPKPVIIQPDKSLEDAVAEYNRNK